jgi:hypothetical protein
MAKWSGGATGDAGYTNSIFAGRKDDLAGAYSNNSRGPNWFKDHFLRAYESEYKQRLFALNNTLLSPASVTAIAGAYGTTVPDTNWLNQRFASVNTQCGLGTWFAPSQPVNTSPANGGSIIPPASLTASPYAHTSGNTSGGNAHAMTRWEIRSSDGSYGAPVYNVTTAANLTSLPVPFDSSSSAAATGGELLISTRAAILRWLPRRRPFISAHSRPRRY